MEQESTHPGQESISELLLKSFTGNPHSQLTEGRIVDALRSSKGLLFELMADQGELLIGYNACSPVRIDGNPSRWAAMGPLAVLPDWQKQGIGASLVEEAIARLKAHTYEGCVLVGNPAYYERFGFKAYADFTTPNVPDEYFLALSFSDATPSGIVEFHPAFQVK